MGFESQFDISDYEKFVFDEFYGVYYGQYAMKGPSETLVYLDNPIFNDVTIFNFETMTEGQVIYDEKMLEGMDPYNVFLSGPAPLFEIVNPNANSNRELVVFRDSFASSLLPLMVSFYSKITVIDTRYMASEYIGQFVEFDNQDVLFIYSTMVANDSDMLR